MSSSTACSLSASQSLRDTDVFPLAVPPAIPTTKGFVFTGVRLTQALRQRLVSAMYRLLVVFLAGIGAGCGILSVRLQPHEEIASSTFSLPGAVCANQALFDVSFDRAAFLQSSGLDLKVAKAKK